MPNPDSIRILIVLVSIPLMVIGMRKSLYAAIGYMVFVYCNVSFYYPVFAQFKAELVFAGIILARILLTPHNIGKLSAGYSKINQYMMLFALSIGFSYLFAMNHRVSWDYAVYHFIKTAVLYCMVMMSLDNEKDIKIFAWSFVLMFVYLAYEPTYGFITKTGGSEQMYGTNYVADVGLLSGHVALANNMNQMIPIAYFLIFGFKKRYQQLLAAVPLFIFFVSLVGSGSRGGQLGFLFFALALVFFSKKRLKTGLMAGCVVVILYLTSNAFVSTLARVDMDQTEGRLTGLMHGVNMVKFGNILGVGPGCFALARGQYHGHTMDAHNLYGQLIGELGIPGTIVWFFLIRQIFLNLANSKRILKNMVMEKSFYFYLVTGLQVSLIVRLFISMGSHGLYYFYWYILAAISAAMYVAVKRMEGQKCDSNV